MMADRHIIIVKVRDGQVTDVVFCSCCPAIRVEVRTYLRSDGSRDHREKYRSDETGTYSTEYYEPDDSGND